MICCNPSLTLAAAKARTEIRLKPASIHEPFRLDLLKAQKPIHAGLKTSSAPREVPDAGVIELGSDHVATAEAPDVITRLLRKLLSRRGGDRNP